jgi:two-component system phosphate regulon sensor histidine kinase PhoR
MDLPLASSASSAHERADLLLEAERGRVLIEESRELVLVLDADDRLVAASARAREALEGIVEGEALPAEILGGERGRIVVVVPYEAGGRQERLVYLNRPGELSAYEELRAGFTASVSHELRTPLARLLALLETAELPGIDASELLDQAKAEIAQIRELIDDILFLSELETGREVVGLGLTDLMPVLREVAESLGESAERAGLRLVVTGDESAVVGVRPRMLRVVVQNLVQNAIRYAGEGATLRLSALRSPDGGVTLAAADDGAGVAEADLPRLFERFYRADRARASRGTGLGLAIVKHVVTAAGGDVQASGGLGRGLQIRCVFPPEATR